jgi:hypothetical protein
VVDKSELGMADQMGDIIGRSGDEIIHANNIVAFADESVAKMRAQKSGATGYQYSCHYTLFSLIQQSEVQFNQNPQNFYFLKIDSLPWQAGMNN